MPPLDKDLPNGMPVYEWDEIRKHNKDGDAWVVKDGQVYDVSKFLREHPGGSTIVLPHLGTDIGEVFEDEDRHVHSAVAHSMMDRYQIGLLAGGAAVRANGSSAARKSADFNFDWNKPIIMQIGNLGDKYNEFIHTPQVLDEPARFFEHDFFEFFSRTSWYVIPIVWVPVVCAILAYVSSLGFSSLFIFFGFLKGLLFWSFLEYALHRWLFHLDEWVQFSYWSITLHFLLHGVHHLLPMDPMRLVFPPVLTVSLAVPIYSLFRCAVSEPVALCLLAGGLTGYMAYDLTHYYLHHSGVPPLSYFGSLKTYHLAHHYKNPKLGYGITSKLWDHVLGTVLDVDAPSALPGKAKAA
mmetsp:Transcript_14593/g.29194  ORF Transcript_14593/g.29194 Transcript_14593/m.29194 type:complete len:352 (+) Transcript_14593:248-1303(+)